MCEYVFIFLRIMNGLFCEHIEYVLKNYDKSWLEAQYGIYSLARDNHTTASP